MIGVKTARAMVIDDEPEEALPVLMALGRMGIGAVYLRGDRHEDLPDEPLDGIRLLFLDMILTGSTEAGQVIGHLMAVLKRVLPTDPHPILIVLWTKHLQDYGAAFTQALQAEFKQLPPGVVVALEKDRFAGLEPETVKKIAEAITEEITRRAPMNLVWHWEQSVHDAASRTTSALVQLVLSRLSAQEADFLSVLWRILKAMVIAAGGEAKHTPDGAVALLFETLNFIHFDRVETTLEQQQLPPPLKPAMEELARVFHAETSPQEKAQLNTMILVSHPVDGIPRPGSAYLRRTWPKPDQGQVNPFDLLPGSPKELTKELFDPYRDVLVQKSLAEEKIVQGQKAAGGARADAQNRINALWGELEGAFEDALVEFTPICDFAQGKQSMTRLVRGFLVADKWVHLLKQAPFLNSIGPINIPDAAEPCHLVMNARYVTGLPRNAGYPRPIFRIRQQVMVSLQAWFASHAGRPGYLFIDR